MVSTGVMDMGDIGAPGSAYVTALYRYAAYRSDVENYGIVRGGMGGITQSMRRSAEARGASIRTGAEVRRTLTRGEAATGVELMDGEVVNADVVISNADPKRTFLGLLREADLDDELVAEVKALKTQAASVKLLCAMRELPDFSGYLGPRARPQASGDGGTLSLDRYLRDELERRQERPGDRHPHHPGTNSVGVR